MIASALIFQMWGWYAARKIRNRFVEFVKLKDYLNLLRDLSHDFSIPKYATHLVYLTSANMSDEIEAKVIYSILQKQPKRYKLPPNIIIHTNHDSIHGDLIEIISTDDNDSAAVYDYENSIHHVDRHPYIDDEEHDVLASSSVSSSSIRQRLLQSNDKDTVSSSPLKPYTLFENIAHLPGNLRQA